MRAASYLCAQGLAEALDALALPGAIVVAGGTDLMVKGRTRDAYASRGLVDVCAVPELLGVREHDGMLDVGAAEPLANLVESESVRRAAPVLWQAARHVGGVQTRNRATLGGNLANACPAADGIVALVALGATLQVAGPGEQRRSVPVEGLFRPCPACLAHEGMLVRTCLFADPVAKKTTLAPGELIERVLVPVRGEGERGVFRKLTCNEGVGLATVNVAARVSVAPDGVVRDARACVGGLFPAPVALEGEGLPVEGTRLGAADAQVCAEVLARRMDAECARLADGAYKRRVALALLADALRALVDDGSGRDVPGVPGLREVVEWS